ncbi:MAG: c-type cytochrome biogenesis protein CcmI [Pyrinomonadaceae bacterium]
MILFWVICALLIVIALSFVLPPLLQKSPAEKRKENGEPREANLAIYRDQLSELEGDLRNGIVSQQQYEQDRDEINRRLLEDVPATVKKEKSTREVATKPNTGYIIAAALPILAVVLYLKVGDPQVIKKAPMTSPPVMETNTAQANFSQQQIQANMEALAKRLQSNPSDSQGWIMLGRSYSSMEKYKDASDAYAKASALEPKNADLLAEYAFSLAMSNGQQLQGQPAELIKRALQLDPENLKALELSGSISYQARDYKQAVAQWQKLLAKVPSNSEVAQAVNERLTKAKALATGAKN